jgi:hypothetical protein
MPILFLRKNTPEGSGVSFSKNHDASHETPQRGKCEGGKKPPLTFNKTQKIQLLEVGFLLGRLSKKLF